MNPILAAILDIAFLGLPPVAIALAIVRNEHRIHRARRK